MKTKIFKLLFIFTTCICSSCNVTSNKTTIQKYKYGVFIGEEDKDIENLYTYETVVIDGQYFRNEDIKELHDHNVTVYSYLNVGSLENFRDYYNTFKDITLSTYDNWDEEYWIDVSNTSWQNKIYDLADSFYSKDIDGLFLDNFDVYDLYHTDEIFNSLTTILENLSAYHKPIIINGGDTYITTYMNQNNNIADLISGINQESVFTSIDFENNTFKEKNQEDRQYFQNYIETCFDNGLDVYILEYTNDSSLIHKIEEYCSEHNFQYYISDNLELNNIKDIVTE